MAFTRMPLVAAILGCALLLGCENDTEKLPPEAANTASRPVPGPGDLHTVPGPGDHLPGDGMARHSAHSGSNAELPGGIGHYKTTHDTNQGKFEFTLVDLPEASGGIKDASLWLAGPNGPVLVNVEPCPGDRHCVAARSELLRQPALRGVLRFELDGQRYRISLGTPKPETQPASGRLAAPTQPETAR